MTDTSAASKSGDANSTVGGPTLNRPAGRTPPQDCNPDQWRALIGQPADRAAAIPDPKRVIRPGMAITQDYRPERTNVDLDSAGRITRIWCG